MLGKTRSNSRRLLLSGYLFFTFTLTFSLDVNAQRQKSYFVSSGLMINQIVVPEFAEYSDYIKISPSLGTSLGIGKTVTKKGKFYTSISVGIESPRMSDGMTAYDLTDRIQEIDDRLTPTRFYYLTTLSNTVSTNIQTEIRGYGGLVNDELDFNYTETTQSVGPNLFPVIYKHYHFIGIR